LNIEGDQELSGPTEAELSSVRDARDKARADLEQLLRGETIGALESQLQALQTRRLRIDRDLMDSEALVSEYAERIKQKPQDAPDVQRVLSLEQARAGHLREQSKDLENQMTQKNQALAERTQRLEEAPPKPKNTNGT